MVPGVWEWVIIGGVVVLLFGTNKLPKLGSAIGESIKNFKKGIKDADKIDAGTGEDEKTQANKNQD